MTKAESESNNSSHQIQASFKVSHGRQTCRILRATSQPNPNRTPAITPPYLSLLRHASAGSPPKAQVRPPPTLSACLCVASKTKFSCSPQGLLSSSFLSFLILVMLTLLFALSSNCFKLSVRLRKAFMDNDVGSFIFWGFVLLVAIAFVIHF